MTKASRLLNLYATVGNKLDTAAPDHDAMRFLLRARRAVAASIEANRITEAPRSTEADRQTARDRATAPFRLIGVDADGFACYQD
jgi:hypothetical protein